MNTEMLKQAIEIAKILDDNREDKTNVQNIGRPVIVRSRDAGVLFGDYAGNDGSTVHLHNAVQMWTWKAAKGGTLTDCATYGVDASGCKFSFARATVTVFNACALIYCTELAAKSIASIEGGDWT